MGKSNLSDKECKFMRTLGLSLTPTVSFLGPIIYASPTFLGTNVELTDSVLGHYCCIGHSSCATCVRCGNYVTMGNNINLSLGRHPISEFSTSEAFSHSFIFPDYVAERCSSVILEKGSHFEHAYIGHDVTIGDHVLSTSTIDIGHGAIIKAGSLLTHSVPPYAIVEGQNRVVGQRCKDEVISDLLELKWWNYDLPAAQKQGMVIPSNLADFVKWCKDTDLSNFKLSGVGRLIHVLADKTNTAEFSLSYRFFDWEIIGTQHHPSTISESLLAPKNA